MRLKTFTGCGFDRFNLGEELVSTMLTEIYEEATPPPEYALVWMKVIRLKNNNIILDIALSDIDLDEYYHGPHLVFKIEPDELESRMGPVWRNAKPKLPGKSAANCRSVFEVGNKVLVFLKNFLQEGQSRLIGIDVIHEYNFLKEFIPEIISYLNENSIDLGVYANQLSSRRDMTKSIQEDYEFFRKAKMKYNITI